MANITVPIVVNGLEVAHRVLDRVGCDLEGSDDLQKGFILCRNIMLNALEKVMAEGEQTEQVNHPAHYNRPGRKECIEEMIDKYGPERTADWCEMTAFKYDYRAGEKEGNPEEQDKAKEDWYLDKAAEIRLKYGLTEAEVQTMAKEDEQAKIADVKSFEKEDKENKDMLDIRTDEQFLSKAIDEVANYTDEHLDKSDAQPEYKVFVVWYCKTLQNFKALLSTSLFDGMYYEVTYNGDKGEMYLDAYKKFENRCITE